MTTILIVDDDTGIRSQVADCLTQYGATILVARDGEGKRCVLLSAVVERGLLDLMLPGEDGINLCRWLCVNAPELFDTDGAWVSQPSNSSDFLLPLKRNPGRILTRDQLRKLSRGRRAELFDRSIDVQLSRLRRQQGQGYGNRSW